MVVVRSAPVHLADLLVPDLLAVAVEEVLVGGHQVVVRLVAEAVDDQRALAAVVLGLGCLGCLGCLSRAAGVVAVPSASEMPSAVRQAGRSSS